MQSTCVHTDYEQSSFHGEASELALLIFGYFFSKIEASDRSIGWHDSLAGLLQAELHTPLLVSSIVDHQHCLGHCK